MFHRFRVLTSVFMLGFLFLSGASHAEEGRGVVLKTTGEVSIVNAQGEARNVTGTDVVLHEKDTVTTSADSQAVVRFNDGALSVLEERSSLQVESDNWLSHLGGKIYFTFRKVFSGSRQVETKFSTIGIRGTTFIVYDNEEGEAVALQEGELELESPDEEYEIHREKPTDDFAAFKQQAQADQEAMQKEYQAYKEQTMTEFVEYKKSFTLEANRVVRFDGKRVDESAMNETQQNSFSDFEAIAGEMLESFRRQSQQHREQQRREEEQEEGWF